jgi:hypothetical protein
LVTQETQLYAQMTCRACAAIILVPVTMDQLDRWTHGTMLQDAFSNLSPDLRELFLSGFCGPCFDNLFKELS